MKKLICLVLIAGLAVMPATAFATPPDELETAAPAESSAKVVCYRYLDGIFYQLFGNFTAVAVKITTQAGETVTPRNFVFVLGRIYNVVSIGEDACLQNRYIKYALISGQVETIMEYAFSRCYNLAVISFECPNNLQLIERRALFSSDIKSINIPASVR
jgi:hypothetical protein